LRDDALLVGTQQGLVERHHQIGIADVLDVVEGLAFLLAVHDQLVGADGVGQDVVHGPASAADLRHQPLADDPANRLREALADLLLLLLVEHADDAGDGLAGVDGVQRGEHPVAPVTRMSPFFSPGILLKASGSFSSSTVGIFVSSFRRTTEKLPRWEKMLTRKRAFPGRKYDESHEPWRSRCSVRRRSLLIRF